MAFCGILLEYDKILMISLTNWMASFCYMHHPPVITSFGGGMVTIPSDLPRYLRSPQAMGEVQPRDREREGGGRWTGDGPAMDLMD